MKFYEQEISGVFIIEPEPYIDDRGLFRRHFCEKEFKSHKLLSKLAQCNVSENKHKYTLRGFHYQLNPYWEAKTLSCLKGSIYDIVVDLRLDSPTYLKWVGFELSETNKKSVHIPLGCANAFLTLEDNSLIHYYCSEFYNPKFEKGIRYNDPLFNFEWPANPEFVSDKDNNYPDFTL